MNNRKHNSSNPFQGPEDRLLFLCSAGLLRSPTAAAVFWNKGYNTRAAGVDSDYALIPVDDVLLDWADKILLMEDWQATRLLALYPDVDQDKLYVLNIVDVFERNDPDLIRHLEARAATLEDYKYKRKDKSNAE